MRDLRCKLEKDCELGNIHMAREQSKFVIFLGQICFVKQFDPKCRQINVLINKFQSGQIRLQFLPADIGINGWIDECCGEKYMNRNEYNAKHETILNQPKVQKGWQTTPVSTQEWNGSQNCSKSYLNREEQQWNQVGG